ncbi:host specificity factor TipJ family phage tail protein [Bradyrhizobium sp. USDA 4452]
MTADASRPSARRERRSAAARCAVTHMVMPGLEVASAEPRRGETVTAFLRRTGWAVRDREYGWQFRKGLPTILEINGEAVLRKDWRRRRIRAADVVRFTSYPLGGGNGGGAKQVIGLIALVAVSAFAFWAGPALAGALFGDSALAGSLLTAGIAIGGSLLVNALVAPKAGATNTPGSTQDQIYSVLAQGNVAKLGQPLPVWYGRLKAYPDFAATPWAEFVANDQYLNVLLSVTMGSMAYEAIYVDETVFWDSVNGLSATFAGAQIAFYEPGDQVTLFPTNVDQSAEVTGQQLPSGSGFLGGQYMGGQPVSPGAWLGPFVANPAGTQAQSIAIDFVFPAGCFTYNKDNGSIGYATVGLTAEYAPCNDAGAQTGAFVPLFAIARSYNAQSPIRDSLKVDVPPGRYLVRFRREDAELSGSNGANSVIWAGLRSFLKGNNSFPDVSTIAIRLKASQSTQGSYKFGVLGTRKLLVWDGSTFTLQPTRNNAWAFLDAATSGQYGSGLPISKVDFNAVVTHALGCAARDDTFDYRFTTAVAVPDALDKILTPSRAKHYWLGDTISIVRDEWRDVPTMLLTDREIVRDSTQVSFTMLGDEDPDAVIVEYIDEDTWLPAQVQYPPNGPTFTSVFADTRRVDGIVNREQAFRECAFYYLQSIYRRENVQLGVEYEGRAITLGSVVRVQSELPESYGYGGAVTDVAGLTLTLSPAPVWSGGPFYIRLRRPNGKFFGPVACSQGADPTRALLNAGSLAAAEAAQSTTLAAVLAREDGGEYPSFELGSGVSQSRLCVVLNGSPNGETFTLKLVVDDERVHATDLGNPPILPIGQFPANDKVPLIAGLNANFGQGTAEPKLSASWFPSAGALYYIADVSYDSGVSWIQVYEGQASGFDVVVSPAALRLRVQAVNQVVRGPYGMVDLEAPTIQIAPGAVALQSLIDGIKYQVTTLQDQVADTLQEVTQKIAAIAANQDARNWLDKKEVRSQLAARSDAAFAEIDDVRTVAVDTQAAFASFSTTVTARFGTVEASVTTNAQAIATLDGYAAAAWSVTVNAAGAVAGVQLVNGGSGKSAFVVSSDKFQIQLPGYNGGNPVPVFTAGTINGSPAIGIAGNVYLDGFIFTRMIGAGQVTTINLAAQSVTAAIMAVDSITAANGAIQNLSVQSLKIADNAIIVPIVQSARSLSAARRRRSTAAPCRSIRPASPASC